MEIRRYFEFALVLYWLSVAMKMFVVFGTTLYSTSIIYNDMKDAQAYCLGDTRIQNVLTESCVKAKEYLQIKPIHRAFSEMTESLYSCGHISCQTIVLSILNSWAGIACMFVGVTVTIFYLFRWMEFRMHRAYAKNRDIHSTQRLPSDASCIQFTEYNSHGNRYLAVETLPSPTVQQITGHTPKVKIAPYQSLNHRANYLTMNE